MHHYIQNDKKHMGIWMPWVDQMQFFWSWFDMGAYRYPYEQRSSSPLDLVQDKNKVVSRRDN
jgi:hypothetical protein